MPRDLPLGNGQLLIHFDSDHQIRDFYYPYVGKENHTGGYPCRIGIQVNSRFLWIQTHQGFIIQNEYEPDTLVTQVRITHPELGIELIFRECVDFHETIFIRKVELYNHNPFDCEVRLFFHQDFRISESDIGDTALYDPRNQTLVHYKGQRYFLMNLLVQEQYGVTHFAVGQKGYPNREGTFKDAEDGELSKNAIAQGAVDSVVAAHIAVPSKTNRNFYYWIVVASKWDGDFTAAYELNEKIVSRGPESFLERTRGYWKLWAKKEPLDFADLPQELIQLYRRSLLVIRTQIDNRGAIIAANDTDIMAFNRDTYSYMWPRDGALVAHALDLAGYPELSLRFFNFCADVLSKDGFLFHKYNPDQSLASSWHPWLIGNKLQLPIQEDETALVMWALWKHFQRYRDIESIKPLYGRLVKKMADFMVDYREPHTGLPAPSYDLWEEHRGIFTFTCSSVYGGLWAAAEFAKSFGDNDSAARYVQAATEIKQAMDSYLWRPELGRFARMIQVVRGGHIEVDNTIDSSLWGLFAFSTYAADDPRVQATIEAVYQELWCKTQVGGIARYPGDQYQRLPPEQQDVPGNPWFLCTLWYADYIIAKAQKPEELQQALELLMWVEKHKLSSGILAEQINPYNGKPLSVAPLTWAHATYVATIQFYLDKLEFFSQNNQPIQSFYRKMRSKDLKGFGHIHLS